jgi:hypothetical protein
MDQSPEEKVLSVMPQGRAMELLNICGLSGYPQDFILKILRSQEAMGKVKRIQPDEKMEPFWMLCFPHFSPLFGGCKGRRLPKNWDRA